MRTSVACCALWIAGCTNGNCDDEICDIDVVVDLHPRGDAWKDGAYRMTWRGDGGKTSQCKFEVPVGFVDCDRPFAISGKGTICRASPEVGGGESGSCTPGITQFVMRVWLKGTPASLAVTLQREGDGPIEQTFSPGYRTYYPNGTHCDPVCRESYLDFTFDPT